jgi:hypothetical protein
LLAHREEKPFHDGELKEAFLIGVDCLLEGVSNKREIMLAKRDLLLS